MLRRSEQSNDRGISVMKLRHDIKKMGDQSRSVLHSGCGNL